MIDDDKLKQRALEILKQKGGVDKELYNRDLTHLVEELSIYRIELEQQNQALRKANEDLTELKDKYFTLFNHAPIGYIIINDKHSIQEINDTACSIMHHKKAELIGKKITKFIDPDFQDNFYLYFKQIDKSNSRKSIDIAFKVLNNIVFHARLIGMPASEIDDTQLKLAMIDISLEKELEIELDKHRSNLEKMVKERTEDIEQKNTELEEKNTQLQKYQQLFVEREFRIKELEKELDKKSNK